MGNLWVNHTYPPYNVFCLIERDESSIEYEGFRLDMEKQNGDLDLTDSH